MEAFTKQWWQNAKECEGKAVTCDEEEPSRRRVAICFEPLDLKPNGWPRFRRGIAVAMDEGGSHNYNLRLRSRKGKRLGMRWRLGSHGNQRWRICNAIGSHRKYLRWITRTDKWKCDNAMVRLCDRAMVASQILAMRSHRIANICDGSNEQANETAMRDLR